MLRVFLVDDEPPARARMRQLLGEAGDVLVVGEAGDAVEAQAAIVSSRPDVVFLDIEMPQTSGTALARLLPEPRPLVVFATAFDHYALDAFAVEATDYLVKPITRARLAQTLGRIRERLTHRSDLERELVAASAAQVALQPPVAALPGFDVARVTLPARGVGGDLLVAQPVAGGSGRERFVLALGDVAGKGMPAGLVASSLQARLETIISHAPGTAIQVVAEANRLLAVTTDVACFATLVLLDVDAASGTVSLVNAGHPAVLCVDAHGALRHLESTGPALGVLPDASFTAHRFTMSPGDTVFVYSDGVSEALDDEGEEFGVAGVAAIVAQQPAADAATLCRRVVDAVRHHAPGPAADDITVLALRRLDSAPTNPEATP